MLGFAESDFWNMEEGALALRARIEEVVDEICEEGYENILYIAIGGTWAHALQMKSIIESVSTIPFYIVNAGEFIYKNTPRLKKNSFVFMESVSGDTEEIVRAAEIVKKSGCRSFGFTDKAETPLSRLLDTCVSFEGGVFYKLFYTFFRFMHNAGDFPDYEKLCDSMKKIPSALFAAKRKFDPVAESFAKEYGNEKFIYLIGAGHTFGGVYSYAMCVLEEMQWIPTKSIEGAEFFHGTLEIIDRDVPVMIYKGEDFSRAIMERVENFLHRVTRKLFVVDLADFKPEGVDPALRAFLDPFVLQALNERISKHLEFERRHPLDIRRYYRRLKY
ncbi:MAG: SIS domain-containing protein [Clostridiales Family XIII bacterium]|jgi:fructoselysine-6-phosphate deglycase|nr:SIS domain-containing protein [Clostridiales Family XIII bacterium]